jgi:hypothetical protein
VRAIIHKPDLFVSAESEATTNIDKPTPPGYSVGIDSTKLVESVYVSPTATDWFYKLVESTSARFNANASIKRSGLGDKPLM